MRDLLYVEYLKIEPHRKRLLWLVALAVFVNIVILYATSESMTGKYALAHSFNPTLSFEDFTRSQYSDSLNLSKLILVAALIVFVMEPEINNGFTLTIKIIPLNAFTWVVAKSFIVLALYGIVTLCFLTFTVMAIHGTLGQINLDGWILAKVVLMDYGAVCVLVIISISLFLLLRMAYWSFILCFLVLYLLKIPIGNPLAVIYYSSITNVCTEYLYTLGVNMLWVFVCSFLIKKRF